MISYNLMCYEQTIDEPGIAERWRGARDSRVGTRRRVIVAFPSRRAVAAKNAPRDRLGAAAPRSAVRIRADMGGYSRVKNGPETEQSALTDAHHLEMWP
jgi:hypothetical protein